METNSKKEMVNHLSKIVIPVLREKGFKGSIPHFRRLTAERIHLLTFQFDKYGGGFVIEIANSLPGGHTTSWSAKVVPNKLTAHDLSNRKRIQANMSTPENSGKDDWFRYDKAAISDSHNVYKDVCEDILSKLELAEDYWKKGPLGN